MIPYWLLFIPFAFGALVERVGTRRRILGPSGALLVLLLTLVVGFRHQVGGDWGNYLRIFDMFEYIPVAEALAMGDPAYSALNSLSAQLGFGVYGVNIICAAFFSLGLVLFCRQQPRPTLALVAAIPYLVIVVGMGYSRQAVALGCGMAGLVALMRGRKLSFAVWVVLGALFHKTAVVLLPIAALAASENKIWTSVWVVVLSAAAYVFTLQDSIDHLVGAYVDSGMQSEGALLRVAMNAVPAMAFLALRKKFQLDPNSDRLWTWLSILSIATLLLLFAMPGASTAIDRMALYLIPLQVYVISRLPDALFASRSSARTAVVGAVAYSAAVQFVWLNFAAHAYAWVPYRFYWLEVI
jgi:hypothetical protein